MKRYAYILFLMVLALGMVSCSKSEDIIPVPEGLPASVTFSLVNTDPEIIETKGMTTSEEQNISRVFILIFDSNNTMVASQRFTDIRTSMVMPAYSGTGMQFYAIANYDTASDAPGNPGIESALAAVENLSQLQEVLQYAEGVDAARPGLLTMVGNSTVTITANSSNIVSINLYYLTAKITVKFVDATSDQKVRFFGWRAYNLPAKGYVIGGDSDAVDPSDADDFYSIEGDNAWEKEEVLSAHHTVSESFYMFENRRGISSETYSGGYKDKTKYAPEGASYLMASLSCVNGGQTYDINTKVYLGANNTNDYNVQRSKHYTYTITISGVNSITVDVATDSNTDVIEFPMVITTSGTLTFDAHPDQRIIKINADGDMVQNVSIEVLNSTSWLKISPLSLMDHQVRQNGNRWQQEGTKGYFVRSKYIPHHSVREAIVANGGTYTPPEGITLTNEGTGDGISDLELPYDDDELPLSQATFRMCNKITGINFANDGSDTYKFSIYSDEYEYIDGLTARSAVIRISYEDKSAGNVVKYADYEVFQRQPMDIGALVTTLSPTTKAVGYQNAVIEQIEESALIIEPGIETLQEIRRMQWGYSAMRLYAPDASYSDYDIFRNGYFLTANTVYGNGSVTWDAVNGYVTRDADGGNVDWAGNENSYRPKYGNGTLGGVNALSQPTSVATSGSPYYVPVKNTSDKTKNYFYQPVYNSSAARYCHEKNRDLNGDGELSAEETRWYLPSQHELYQMWICQEAIKYSTTEFGTGYYWSSTEYYNGSSTVIPVIGFKTGYIPSAGRTKSSYSDADNDVVRCIRRVDSSPSDVVLSNRIIDCSSFPSDAVTTVTKGSAASGMQGDDGISTNASTAFHQFQVAKTDANTSGPAGAGVAGNSMTWTVAMGYSSPYTGDYPADPKLGAVGGSFNKVTPSNVFMKGAPTNATQGCAAYWEGTPDDAVTGVGQWRLPNKRELLLMWIYKEELEWQDGFTPFSTNDYWSASERTNSTVHFVNFSRGYGENANKTDTRRTRCIREILN